MKWLLDTNVIAESGRTGADRRLLTWLTARSPDQLAVSIVTIAELHDGISRIDDASRQRRYSDWIESEVMGLFGERILPLTLPILTEWISLSRKLAKRGNPRSAPDMLIAATARIHDLIVVTRNIRDFAGTDVILYDPWKGETHHLDS